MVLSEGALHVYCPTKSEEHTLWERSTHKGGTFRMHENKCWRETIYSSKASVNLLRGSTLVMEDVPTSSNVCLLH